MRIRTIKPEFWTSLTISNLSRDARLTFIGLWNYVDDDGRGVYDARLLKAALWALDDGITIAEIQEHMAELLGAKLLDLYAVEGITYLSVNAWREHQAISKPRPSKLPEPSGIAPVDLLAGREGKGREQGREGNGLETPRSASLNNNPLQPTDRQVYFAERLGVTIAQVVKLNREYGTEAALAAMQQLHGFPPEEQVENVYGYLRTVAGFKKAGVA